MLASLPETGVLVEGTGEFMEARHPETRAIWMTTSPVTDADYESWSPPAPLRRSGIASAAMDRAAFRHCPTGEGIPVTFETFDGHRVVRNCTLGAIEKPEVPGTPQHITVIKAHTVGFRAGRRVVTMVLDEQRFVEVIGDDAHDAELTLPEGAHLETIELDEPWVVELPYPPTSYFWFDHGVRTFQGPLPLAVDARTK